MPFSPIFTSFPLRLAYRNPSTSPTVNDRVSPTTRTCRITAKERKSKAGPSSKIKDRTNFHLANVAATPCSLLAQDTRSLLADNELDDCSLAGFDNLTFDLLAVFDFFEQIRANGRTIASNDCTNGGRSDRVARRDLFGETRRKHQACYWWLGAGTRWRRRNRRSVYDRSRSHCQLQLQEGVLRGSS